MGSINLYKIANFKQDYFFQEINQKFLLSGTQNISKQAGNTKIDFELSLYIITSQKKKSVDWNWLPRAFNNADIKVAPSPKAVLTIKHDNLLYVVTFGYAYFIIDKFCDRDFGFTFARKTKYKEIKTTALTNPNSQRNKTINTYINYKELEFDSGESYAKLKATADVSDDFVLFKPSIEIGGSIKFSIETESLHSILDALLFIENIINTRPDIYKIPVFSKVTNSTLLSQLENQLKADILNNPAKINISELDIIGATEVFNRNDGGFIIRYAKHRKQVPAIDDEEIKSFCIDNDLTVGNILLDISVISLKDGDPIRTDKIKNLIDYTNDAEKCILSKGIWYKYNDDYLQYLKDSLQEIDITYDPRYDFTQSQYNSFIDLKYNEEKNEIKYHGKTQIEIRSALKTKYYAERSFNLLRALNDGFQNHDRDETQIETVKYEITDLYKEKAMYAVKIGKTSSKLCYAVDQSLISLKMYKQGKLKKMPEINTVAIWLVLERKKHLGLLSGGQVNLDDLNMLMLKNKIDQWKKEVRLAGCQPRLYINYKTFEDKKSV
jgi:uncharacterized protein (TIGR04141 family)